MLESTIMLLASLPTTGIILSALIIPFVEHIFPPSPSDVLVIFLGALAGLRDIALYPLAICSVLGAVLGFFVVYMAGRALGPRVLEWKVLRFIPKNTLQRAEQGFARYGYWIIAANRFLAGFRAAIPLFAGVAKLPVVPSLGYAFVSAVVWNTLLLILGRSLGSRWREVTGIIATYGYAITALCLVAALAVVLRLYLRSRRPSQP